MPVVASAIDKIRMGHLTHTHQSPAVYAEGEPEDLLQHSWYHGYITTEQAEAALKSQATDNGFLVRVLSNNLFLSKRVNGWVSHDVIHRSPRGYRLDGKDKPFESIPEMVTHYQHHSIDGVQVLGTAITTVPSGQ